MNPSDWYSIEGKLHKHSTPPSYRRALNRPIDVEIRLIISPHERAMKRREQDLKEWKDEDARNNDAEDELGHREYCYEGACDSSFEGATARDRHMIQRHGYTEDKLKELSGI